MTPTTYEITYPGGARDAEALLVHPETGQVLVASKGLMAGILYAAPERLSESDPNRLRAVADVPGLVTDGAFFPDGRHFVLRSYSRAVVYTYPGFESVGDVTLPEQEQGEGIAVDEEGRVYLSSEGQRAPVLRIDLPPRIERAVAPPETESASPAHDAVSQGGEQAPDARPRAGRLAVAARRRGRPARHRAPAALAEAALMPRLRRTSPDEPGWTRRRAGAGFVYLDENGDRLSEQDAQRCKDLVIPPAWEDVWITPLRERPPAGGRHRRRRPAAVPLPPGLADPPRRREVRPDARLRQAL